MLCSTIKQSKHLHEYYNAKRLDTSIRNMNANIQREIGVHEIN